MTCPLRSKATGDSLSSPKTTWEKAIARRKLGQGGQVTHLPNDYPSHRRYEVRLAYSPLSNRSTRTPVTIEHAQGESTVQVNQQLPTPEYGRFLSLGEFNFEEESLSSITVSTNGTDGYVVADAVQWFLLEEETESKSPEREGYLATLKREIKTLEIKLKPITNKLKARPIAMSVKEDPEPSNSAIRIRGIESRKEKSFRRGFLQVALYDGAPEIPRHASGRAELAGG